MRCIFSWFTAHSWLEAGRIARDQAQILEAKSQDRKEATRRGSSD
jgi:hypothetical protein